MASSAPVSASTLPMAHALQLAVMLQAPDAVRRAIAFEDAGVAGAAPFLAYLADVAPSTRAQMAGLILAPLDMRLRIVASIYASLQPQSGPQSGRQTGSPTGDLHQAPPLRARAGADAGDWDKVAPGSVLASAPTRIPGSAPPALTSEAVRAALATVMPVQIVRMCFVVQGHYQGGALPPPPPQPSRARDADPNDGNSIREAQQQQEQEQEQEPQEPHKEREHDDGVMEALVNDAICAAVPRFKEALEAEWVRAAPSIWRTLGCPDADSRAATLSVTSVQGKGDPECTHAMRLWVTARVTPGDPARTVSALVGFCGHLLQQLRAACGVPLDQQEQEQEQEQDPTGAEAGPGGAVAGGPCCCVHTETVRNRTVTLFFAADPAACALGEYAE